jgi:hypothetical protein
MSSPIFVSAIYDIERTGYVEDLWSRVNVLAASLPNLHLFCSAADAACKPTHPNIQKQALELTELDTYRLLHDVTSLPTNRNEDKDTLSFLILQNAKTEFLRRTAVVLEATHYIWIDAGLVKVLQTVPPAIPTQFDLRDDQITIPGCWGPCTDATLLTERVYWRFCGGLFVVPAALVEAFAAEVLSACAELKERTGKATWEVNVWAFIEHRLPIRWIPGDHNDSILKALRGE